MRSLENTTELIQTDAALEVQGYGAILNQWKELPVTSHKQHVYENAGYLSLRPKISNRLPQTR